MFVGIQLFGILFALVMIYFSTLYYRRGNFGKKSYLLWLATWIGVIIVFAVPQIIYKTMVLLTIQRTADFFTSVAIIFLTTIVFYLYTSVKSIEQKMEKLVREEAITKAKKKK